MPEGHGDRRADAREADRQVILIADDEPKCLDTLETALQQTGFGVMSAANGREAVAAFAQHHHRLAAVILDFQMTDVDGVECVAQMRGIAAGVPIVLATGAQPSDEGTRLEDSGANALLLKPFGMRQLLSTLDAILRKENGSGTALP